VSIWAEIKDKDGAYVDPSEPVLLTLRYLTKDGTELKPVFADAVMTKSVVGKYVYYWQTTLTEVLGVPVNPPAWYKPRVVIQDGSGAGAKVTVVAGGFILQ